MNGRTTTQPGNDRPHNRKVRGANRRPSQKGVTAKPTILDPTEHTSEGLGGARGWTRSELLRVPRSKHPVSNSRYFEEDGSQCTCEGHQGRYDTSTDISNSHDRDHHRRLAPRTLSHQHQTTPHVSSMSSVGGLKLASRAETL